MRLSGADINPYLGMAASLASGIEGIQRGLEAPHGIANAYDSSVCAPLPRTLSEAVDLFKKSEIARKWFGDAFVDHYAATREWEVRLYNKAVTDWELARYFESI
jgi:glutamine synthetase